jgi:hypothetical protein
MALVISTLYATLPPVWPPIKYKYFPLGENLGDIISDTAPIEIGTS